MIVVFMVLATMVALASFSSVMLLYTIANVPRRYEHKDTNGLILKVPAWSLLHYLPFDIGRLTLLSTQSMTIRRLLRYGIQACNISRAQCVLDGGTLLGQFRHSGELIPFDEDADLILLFDDFSRLRSAWDNKLIQNALRSEFPHFELTFTKFESGVMPKDIVAHAVDLESGLYLDFFVLFEANTNSGRCHNTEVAPRPSKDIYKTWPSDRIAFNQFILGQHFTPGCEFLHGVFSKAWSHCRGCEARPSIDKRRRAHIRRDLLYPLRRCQMVGLQAYCPRDSEGYLMYLYGNDLSIPFLHSVRGRVFYFVLLCASVFVSLVVVEKWLPCRLHSVSSKFDACRSKPTRYIKGGKVDVHV